MGRDSHPDDDVEFAKEIMDFVENNPVSLKEVTDHHDVRFAELVGSESE